MTATNQVSAQKRVAIVGATGMVGGYALRYALENPGVECATAIVRRKLSLSHAKLKEVLHRGFANCSALAETLSAQDAVVFACVRIPVWYRMRRSVR